MQEPPAQPQLSRCVAFGRALGRSRIGPTVYLILRVLTPLSTAALFCGLAYWVWCYPDTTAHLVFFCLVGFAFTRVWSFLPVSVAILSPQEQKDPYRDWSAPRFFRFLIWYSPLGLLCVISDNFWKTGRLQLRGADLTRAGVGLVIGIVGFLFSRRLTRPAESRNA